METVEVESARLVSVSDVLGERHDEIAAAVRSRASETVCVVEMTRGGVPLGLIVDGGWAAIGLQCWSDDPTGLDFDVPASAILLAVEGSAKGLSDSRLSYRLAQAEGQIPLATLAYAEFLPEQADDRPGP